MSLRPRIIPLTITVASLLLMVKMVDLIRGGQELSESLLVARVEAKTDTPEEKKPEAEKKSPDPNKPEEKKAEEKKEGEKAPEEAKKEEEKKEDSGNPNVSSTPGEIADRRFTTVEVELLQKLARRRSELESWEANLQIKETALGATEKRIDDKIAQVESLKKAVAAALAEYNKIEDTEIASLVKIYENMKAADAARIFDELERPILLLIIDRMSEKKAAPILASMDPKRAKMVTVDLAEQRRLKTNNMNNGAASAGVTPPAPSPVPSPAPSAAPGKP